MIPALADEQTIERVWRERWGLPVLPPWGTYQPADVEGLALENDGAIVALVTFKQREREAEIVTLDALERGQGYGSMLLIAAEAALAVRGARRLVLITTSDNVAALGFYLKHGYRLVKVHLDLVARQRKSKPSIPMLGESGLPLNDGWELVKLLHGTGP